MNLIIDPDGDREAWGPVRVLPTRMPFGRSIPQGGVGKGIADWMPAWCDPSLDLQVWLPESHAPLAEAMTAIAGSGSLMLQPWPPAAWLLEPEKVAHALAQEVPPAR